MREKIDCFLVYDQVGNMHERVLQLRDSKTIQHIYLLVPEALQQHIEVPQGCQLLPVQGIASADTLHTNKKSKITGNNNVFFIVYVLISR